MSTQIQKVTNKNTLKGMLDSDAFRTGLAETMSDTMTIEKVTSLALVAHSRSPRLYECTMPSVAASIQKASSLGLDFTGTLGEGYLVPYWNGKLKCLECQFQVGYQGLISLCRRSGMIKRIEARLVYSNDVYDRVFGLEPMLNHKPTIKGEKGELLLAYAIAEMDDGSKQVEEMTNDEIEGIMNRSSSKNKQGVVVGPWRTDFGEMARKTVVKRLCKYLPKSVEKLAEAMRADNYQYEDYTKQARKQVVNEAAEQSGVNGLEARLTKPEPPQTDEPVPDVEVPDVEVPEKEPDAPQATTEAETGPPEVLRFYCKGCDREFPHKKNKKCPACFSTDVIDRRANQQ